MYSQLQEIPAIWIYLEQIGNKQLDQMFWGIEEEGIPYKTLKISINNIKRQAHKAASLSPLAVGIAYKDQEIVVHSRNLNPDNPLFQISLNKQDSDIQQLRNLGCNAARLVKGLPFKPL